MFVQIDLKLPRTDGQIVAFKCTINTMHLITLNYMNGKLDVNASNGNGFEIPPHELPENCIETIYKALLLAIQGQSIDLGEWGAIKPLLNFEIDEQYKFMRYHEMLASLSQMPGDIL